MIREPLGVPFPKWKREASAVILRSVERSVGDQRRSPLHHLHLVNECKQRLFQRCPTTQF